MANKLTATHEGKITIGEIELLCAVLSDGAVVITYLSIKQRFGGKKGLTRIDYVDLAGNKVQGIDITILPSLLPTAEVEVNTDIATTGFDKMLKGLLRVPPPHK